MKATMKLTLAMGREERNRKQKFNALRAKYKAAQKKREDLDAKFRFKYGGEYKPSWLKESERKAYDLASERLLNAGDAFFAHLQSFSPRDWSRGVPVYWLCEYLTYEDASRPLGEALSVTPPMSYGSLTPMV